MQPTEEGRLFSGTAILVVPVLSGGLRKTVRVRFPTDKEWCELQRRQPVVSTRVGDGVTTETENAVESDLELFELIRQGEDGPEIDAAEAGLIMDLIGKANVVDEEGSDTGITVGLEVVGRVRTEHVLRMPTQAQLREHRRAAYSTVDFRKRSVSQYALEPAGRMYDALVDSSSGYKGPTPIIHKEVALTAAIRHFRELVQQLEAVPEVESPTGTGASSG